MKKVDQVLSIQIKKITPENKELKILTKKTKEILFILNENIRKNNIDAKAFVAGSFAKKTMLKKSNSEVDIFVKFNKKYSEGEIKKFFLKIIPKNSKKVHGSRDYFILKKDNMVFEIVPSIQISSAKELRNVTDLSLHHVRYVANKIKKRPFLSNEILLTKSFFESQGVYGAESYIQGFSGYSIELLLIYYGSFKKLIKDFSKLENQKIIDIEKQYSSDKQVFQNLNSSKLKSKIILIDPTFKERNALASLSENTFKKTKIACANFLKNPSLEFFMKKQKKEIFANKKNLITLIIKTTKQSGDISGSKIRKFYGFFINELKLKSDILLSDFDYSPNENTGFLFLVIKPKKQIKISGPPITLKDSLYNFKKQHKRIIIKNKKSYAIINQNLSSKEIVKEILNSKKSIIKSMSIKEITLF